jgi:hypothetical protein
LNKTKQNKQSTLESEENKMDAKEKYNVYCRMFENAHTLSDIINQLLVSKKYKVYDCFISVASEEKNEYFLSIEYGNGTQEGYKRIYGNYTEKAVNDYIKRLKG